MTLVLGISDLTTSLLAAAELAIEATLTNDAKTNMIISLAISNRDVNSSGPIKAGIHGYTVR